MSDTKAKWSEDSTVIPREIFADPQIYKEEVERIFKGPTWHLVAHDAELPNAGDYKRTTIVDVPVFVVRGQDGVVRAFINACAHRGTEVVNQKRGNFGKTIRCIYHGWRYEFTGKLTGVWLPDAFPADFRREDYGLTPVRLETLQGCIFVTLSPETMPLAQYLGDKIDELIGNALGNRELAYLGSQTMTFRCNWKLYSENIFDSYHPQVLHGVVRILRTRAAPDSAFDVGFSADGRFPHAWTRYRSLPIKQEDRDVLNDYSLFEVRDREIPYNHVLGFFPGDVLSCQLDVIQLRYVRSRGPDATEVEFANFAVKGESEELVEHRLHQANILGPAGVISLEDGCALERVQWSAMGGGSNIVLKGALPDRPPYRYAEEGAVREFYKSYRALMKGAA
jgi:anthranilate 1,2-dioxygenase large subunit